MRHWQCHVGDGQGAEMTEGSLVTPEMSAVWKKVMISQKQNQETYQVPYHWDRSHQEDATGM